MNEGAAADALAVRAPVGTMWVVTLATAIQFTEVQVQRGKMRAFAVCLLARRVHSSRARLDLCALSTQFRDAAPFAHGDQGPLVSPPRALTLAQLPLLLPARARSHLPSLRVARSNSPRGKKVEKPNMHAGAHARPREVIHSAHATGVTG